MNEQKNQNIIARYYGVGIVIYLVLAVLAVKVMLPGTFQVVTSYWTSNPLLSQGSTVFAPATHVLMSMQFRWAIVVLMGLSIATPAYYVYLISNKEKHIDFHKFRSIDWAITGSLIFLIIATLAGVQDISALILLLALSLLSYCLIRFSIIRTDKKEINLRYVYLLGVVTAVIPWLVVLIYAVSTLIYGGVRTPGFVYLAYLVGLVNSGVVIYGYYWHKANSLRKPVLSDETYPILINQFVKILFVLILIIGLKR